MSLTKGAVVCFVLAIVSFLMGLGLIGGILIIVSIILSEIDS
jgi:hypothetical protein